MDLQSFFPSSLGVKILFELFLNREIRNNDADNIHHNQHLWCDRQRQQEDSHNRQHQRNNANRQNDAAIADVGILPGLLTFQRPVGAVGDKEKVLAFEELLKPFGIKELVRTGVIAVNRGTNLIKIEEDD